MGIPFYFRAITRVHPTILTTSKPSCTSLYVDFNGMIHQAARRVLDEEAKVSGACSKGDELEDKICQETWKYLEDTVKIIKPKKLVSVCIDGVAPVAKMAQQRKRRFLSRMRYDITGKSPLWDTNAITPGTPFMAKLQAYLTSKVVDANKETKKKPLYELSAADEPGEGEHKIFAKIASQSSVLKSDTKDSICIYGLDADLIMLSLMSHTPNIFLMREDTNGSDDFTYLDVDQLRTGIVKTMTTTENRLVDPNGSCESRDLVESYLVGCFLLGNDFLPHISCVSLKKNGHTILLEALRNSPVLVSNGNIDLDALLCVLRVLQEQETQIMNEINDDYMRRAGSGTNPNHEDPDTWPLWKDNKDMTTSQAIAISGQKWRATYYKHCFDTRMNDTSIMVSAAMEFLKGMLWTFAYYKRKAKDDTWLYPYSYAPTCLDLVNTLFVSKADLQSILTNWTSRATFFVHPNVQLLCVLPPDSVPSHLARYTKDPSLGLAHLYPRSYRIKTYLHTKLWECSPCLPPIDIDLVQECIKDV